MSQGTGQHVDDVGAQQLDAIIADLDNRIRDLEHHLRGAWASDDLRSRVAKLRGTYQYLEQWREGYYQLTTSS